MLVAGEKARSAQSMASLLEVQNLHVAYVSRDAQIRPATVGISFSLGPAEILGVLGESGCGKSTLAAALPRLLPPNGKIQRGKILFEGKDLLDLPLGEIRTLRGGRMGLMNQEPSSALHPTVRVGRQVSNVLAAHESSNRTKLHEKTAALLASVFPSDVERISRSFPHQLSGGQRQRVVLAQAIACQPSLLIADEPTASLDATTQNEIIELFRDLRQKLQLSVIFITHNPALLAGFADRILVLYAGRVAEIGPTSQVLTSPRHPYTAALLRSIPTQARVPETMRAKLAAIPGEPPDLSSSACACQFEPRCQVRMDICKCQEPVPIAVGPSHEVACFKFTG